MPESALSIANYFIGKASEAGQELRPMKLLKLVYLAHGWHLGFTGTPLIREEIQAWQYGPVIPELYHDIKQFKDSPIPPDILPNASLKETTKTDLLASVWRGYSQYSGGQLSTLTHQAGSPWDIVWNQQGGKDRRGAVIPNDLIMSHFKEKAENVRRRAANTPS